MTPIRFTVFGVPQSKGSTRAFMRPGMRFPVVTSTNPKVKQWERVVALGGVQARGAGVLPASCAIDLEVEFFLPRPLKFAKRAAPPHITRPDTDKLLRAVGDALTGVLWEDDGQIVKLTATKAYAELGDTPKAVITVRPSDLALFRHIGPQLEAHQ